MRYTTDFGGSSSASAIVAGAVAAIQSYLRAHDRPTLDGATMRNLLVQTGIGSFGWEDANVKYMNIGPMPSIRLAINELKRTSMASGDFNGDGLEDLAIGNPWSSDGEGEIRIYYSSMGTVVFSSANYQILSSGAPGSFPYDRFGMALASGDFNGDGIDDLAVGSTGTANYVSALNSEILEVK